MNDYQVKFEPGNQNNFSLKSVFKYLQNFPWIHFHRYQYQTTRPLTGSKISSVTNILRERQLASQTRMFIDKYMYI